MNEISERIKLALEKRGKTQTWLSEEIGVTQQTICRYVHGKRIPKAPIMTKIADALGVDLSWLLTGREEPTQHIEMIIDYVTDGTDYQYSDNHGVLTRCIECKYWDHELCTRNGEGGFEFMDAHDFCSKAVKA